MARLKGIHDDRNHISGATGGRFGPPVCCFRDRQLGSLFADCQRPITGESKPSPVTPDETNFESPLTFHLLRSMLLSTYLSRLSRSSVKRISDRFFCVHFRRVIRKEQRSHDE